MKPTSSTRFIVGLAACAAVVLSGSRGNTEEQISESIVGEIVRYAPLSDGQKSALRRQFVLPLDALFLADTKRDLAASVVVSPLPDPSKPLLSARRGASEQKGLLSNPFAAAGGANPLGPLGELFQLENGAEPRSVESPGEDVASAPAAIPQSDPFADSGPAPAAAGPSVRTEDPAPADEGDFDDPFADF